jgi:hypothetical protein
MRHAPDDSKECRGTPACRKPDFRRPSPRVVDRVFEGVPRLTWRDYCGATPDYGKIPLIQEDELELHVLFAARNETIEGSIHEEESTTSFNIDLTSVEYSGSSDSVDQKTFRCWSEAIIVT